MPQFLDKSRNRRTDFKSTFFGLQFADFLFDFDDFFIELRFGTDLLAREAFKCNL